MSLVNCSRQMARCLIVAVRLAAAACVVVAEGRWSAYLATQTWMVQPYLALAILGNAAAAVAVSSLILLINRRNAGRIAETLAFVVVGAVVGGWVVGMMTIGRSRPIAGESEQLGTIGPMIGALLGFAASQAFAPRSIEGEDT